MPALTLIAPQANVLQNDAGNRIKSHLWHFAKQNNPAAERRHFGDKFLQSLFEQFQAARHRPRVTLVPIGNRKIRGPARRQNDKFNFR